MGDKPKEILYFENLDLENVVTPVNADRLNELLLKAGYDNVKRNFLWDDFKNGFTLGYNNPNPVQVVSHNLKLRVGDEVDLWNKVMKEVKLKRFAGPFSQIPFQDDFIQSPIGLVPKDSGKDTRLIFHLSYPRCKVGKSTLVNANSDPMMCKVQYPDLCDTIVRCLQEGIPCYLSKSDHKSAFRNLGISRRFWRYLILKARNPLDGKNLLFCRQMSTILSLNKLCPFSESV